MGRRERGEEVRGNPQILVDTDAFVGWFWSKDAHHMTAKSIFGKIKKERLRLVTTSWVVAETATVLSNRVDQRLACSYLSRMKRAKFPTIHIDESLQDEATRLFEKQSQKRTSMIDCGNVIVMQRFNIPTIFSFDRFYKKHPQIQMPEAANLL